MGEGNGDDVLLVMDVESEATIRARLADDPWANDMLTIESVEPWSVWLRRRNSARSAVIQRVVMRWSPAIAVAVLAALVAAGHVAAADGAREEATPRASERAATEPSGRSAGARSSSAPWAR